MRGWWVWSLRGDVEQATLLRRQHVDGQLHQVCPGTNEYRIRSDLQTDEAKPRRNDERRRDHVMEKEAIFCLAANGAIQLRFEDLLLLLRSRIALLPC